MRKDFADVFADQGEAARELLGHLRERAVDALQLELSEAPKGSNSLGAYRVAKERVLPLLLKLEDEGERDAVLHDVAAKLKLSIKPLRKALAAMLEEHRGSQEEEQTDAPGDGAPEPGSARHERAMKVLGDRRLLSRAAVDMKRLGHVGEFAAKKLALHDPAHADKRRRAASKAGKSKPSRELAGIKQRFSDLAEDVLAGTVDRGDAAVVGQLLNTYLRAVSVELKAREQLELVERLESLEEALETKTGNGGRRWGA